MKREYFRAFFASELAGPPPARFGVVTACDPDGVPAPPARNALADRRLRARLDELGLPCFRVTGGSRDGRHREPGWGVVADSPGIVRALAREFRQLAFYWVADGRVLVGESRGGTLRAAGVWGARRASWR